MLGPRRFSVLGVGALLGATLAMVQPTGCIIPDHCILVRVLGDDWCTIINAQMWPIGSPELAEPVRAPEGGAPKGCRCLNATEAQEVDTQVPEEKYLLHRAQIEQAARNECASSVPPGFDHDCYDPSATFSEVFMDDSPQKSGTCYKFCFYTNPGPAGCPDDPNPFECNEREPGGVDEAGETGASTETGSAVNPDEVIR